MTGKRCAKKHKANDSQFKLDVPIEKSGSENKFLKTDKKNPFTGEFF
jgi:hypothetical protein